MQDAQALPIKALMDRYCFYRRKYVLMKDEHIMRVDSPYSDKQVWEHLNGNMCLCVFAGPSNTTFLTIDVDLKSHTVVKNVVRTMVDLGFPEDKIYVSESGNKGYHVDVFFEHSIYNWMAKQLYDLIIYFGQFNPRKVEYRPTAKNAIKLPLGTHQKTGKRCWFIDLRSMTEIEDMTYIERTEKIPVWQVEKIIKDGNKRRYNLLLEEIKGSRENEQPENARVTHTALKPSKAIVLLEEGTRHRRMIEQALFLYRKGGDYDSIHGDLISWLAAQDPRLYKDSWEECMRDIDNITAWVMQKGRRHELGDDAGKDDHTGTRIYESDIRRIIRGATKASRLLAFLFTVYCDRYEFCGLGEHKLCVATGIRSNKTIAQAAADLVGKGLFRKTKGGYRNTGTSLRPVTNKYRFPDNYVREGEFVEVNCKVDATNIYQIYIMAIAAFSDRLDLAGLTAGELVAIRAAKEGITA